MQTGMYSVHFMNSSKIIKWQHEKQIMTLSFISVVQARLDYIKKCRDNHCLIEFF